LFGKNGFINSDFFTPVTYLALKFWPMVLGSLAANAEYLFRRASSRKFLVSLQAEILRIHVLIVALPFLTLLVWTAFKASYQSVAVVLLNAIFFLMPGKDADVETAGIDGKQNMKISMSQ
ncbi:MAG TPA: hypothetical protein PLB62_13685, partial [Candidatus Sumerlaeota bacterium]|nr:hypothetical protein [Candidatus Sumerlaeota bacterium]